jgi:hypothetical protein
MTWVFFLLMLFLLTVKLSARGLQKQQSQAKVRAATERILPRLFVIASLTNITLRIALGMMCMTARKVQRVGWV